MTTKKPVELNDDQLDAVSGGEGTSAGCCKCSECDFATDTYYELIRHLEEVHNIKTLNQVVIAEQTPR